VRFPGGEMQSFDVWIGEIRQISEPGLRIVERKRVQRGDFHSADTRRLHLFEFALDLGFGDRRTKPPPAHHDAGTIGRMRKRLAQTAQIDLRLGKSTRATEQQNRKNNQI